MNAFYTLVCRTLFYDVDLVKQGLCVFFIRVSKVAVRDCEMDHQDDLWVKSCADKPDNFEFEP